MSKENFIIKLIPTRRLFYDNKSNYGIYACTTEEFDKVVINNWGNFTIKGNTHELILENEYTVKLKSEIDYDKQGRPSYVILSIFEDLPSTPEKQRRYLESILTSNQVDEIYKAYPNEDIIKLIKEDQFDINKVKGIKRKRLEKIKERIIETTEYREAMEFLSDYGISNNLIIKLINYYKSAKLLIPKMKDNPYCIMEIHGIGFKTADVIAMNMNYDPNGEFRIISAIKHTLQEEENQGHTYITKDSLLVKVRELINIDDELIKEQIIESTIDNQSTDDIVVFEDVVALRQTYWYEEYVSEELIKRLNNSIELNINIDDFIIRMEEKYNIKLTNQQKGFFYNVKKYNISYLIGFAGTGKSMLQKLLINLLEELKLSYILLTPTGKSRKVLSNYTQREAHTIHKATGLIDDENEEVIMLDHDVIIVDEVSMKDIRLSAKLLSRIKKNNARIIYIGDAFQIPSVGAGNFLHDSIESGVLPVTKLDIVFRQKEGGILDVATKVRLGEKFIESDFVGIKEFGTNCIIGCLPNDMNKEDRIDKMVRGYQYYYNQYLEKYKPEDIFILTPTKRGELGTISINQVIQNIVNPKDTNKKEITYGKELILREGDYVINTKNTYSILDINDKAIDIVNGDTGSIIKIDEDEIIINIDDKEIPLSFKMLDQILHGWSITMHKSQGSSSKIVIAIIDNADTFMLNANLIYTALTRAEDYLVILTQEKTLNRTMKKIANLQRNTFLKELLVEGENKWRKN